MPHFRYSCDFLDDPKEVQLEQYRLNRKQAREVATRLLRWADAGTLRLEGE